MKVTSTEGRWQPIAHIEEPNAVWRRGHNVPSAALRQAVVKDQHRVVIPGVEGIVEVFEAEQELLPTATGGRDSKMHGLVSPTES